MLSKLDSTPSSSQTATEAMIDTFFTPTHFRTYAGERNASFSANCNALLALLHCGGDAARWGREIGVVVGFLCAEWWGSDGRVVDKWVSFSLPGVPYLPGLGRQRGCGTNARGVEHITPLSNPPASRSLHRPPAPATNTQRSPLLRPYHTRSYRSLPSLLAHAPPAADGRVMGWIDGEDGVRGRHPRRSAQTRVFSSRSRGRW